MVDISFLRRRVGRVGLSALLLGGVCAYGAFRDTGLPSAHAQAQLPLELAITTCSNVNGETGSDSADGNTVVTAAFDIEGVFYDLNLFGSAGLNLPNVSDRGLGYTARYRFGWDFLGSQPLAAIDALKIDLRPTTANIDNWCISDVELAVYDNGTRSIVWAYRSTDDPEPNSTYVGPHPASGRIWLGKNASGATTATGVRFSDIDIALPYSSTTPTGPYFATRILLNVCTSVTDQQLASETTGIDVWIEHDGSTDRLRLHRNSPWSGNRTYGWNGLTHTPLKNITAVKIRNMTSYALCVKDWAIYRDASQTAAGTKVLSWQYTTGADNTAGPGSWKVYSYSPAAQFQACSGTECKTFKTGLPLQRSPNWNPAFESSYPDWTQDMCDGHDVDLDGLVDEDFYSTTTMCAPGVCGGARSSQCVAGALTLPMCGAPRSELCNNVDDDCDGLVDESSTCLREDATTAACRDGVDSDADGAVDCADVDCVAVPYCIACVTGQTCGCKTSAGVVLPACETGANCQNQLDDDGNGYADCEEPGCLDAQGNPPAGCTRPPQYTPDTSFSDPTSADAALRLGAQLQFQRSNAGLGQATIPPLAKDRAAIVDGYVYARGVAGATGLPLEGVKVSVLDHPEYGFTYTTRRMDRFGHDSGYFIMAVNTGGDAVFQFEQSGYLPVQRTVDLSDGVAGRANDVVMIPRSKTATNVVTNGATSGWQVVRGAVETDKDGSRQAIVAFEPGIYATTYDCPSPGQCTERERSSLNLRVTEFTVGETGLAAMPGALPPTTAYTYAVDLTPDEALDPITKQPMKLNGVDTWLRAGSYTNTPSKMGRLYLKVLGFLDFPPGTDVPLAAYDGTRARWIPSDNGMVLKVVGTQTVGGSSVAKVQCGSATSPAILSQTGDLVSIDCDGSGTATTADLSIKQGELLLLKDTFAVGDSFWRVELNSLSNKDLNRPTEPPNAHPPSGAPPHNTPEDGLVICKDQNASSVECFNQTLHEDVPIVGTPYSLHYSSARVPGRVDRQQLRIGLVEEPKYLPGYEGQTVKFTTTVVVAPLVGTVSIQEFENGGSLDKALHDWTWTWSGDDGLGGKVYGVVPVTIIVTNWFPCEYGGVQKRFGSQTFAGVTVSRPARTPTFNGQSAGCSVTHVRRWQASVEAWDAREDAGLGGWTLSHQHLADHGGKSVLLGGGGSANMGSTRAAENLTVTGFPGLPTPPHYTEEGRIAVASDGTVYWLQFGVDSSFPTTYLYRWSPKQGYRTSIPIAKGTNCSVDAAGLTLAPNTVSLPPNQTGYNFCALRAIAVGPKDELYVADGQVPRLGTPYADSSPVARIFRFDASVADPTKSIPVPVRVAGGGVIASNPASPYTTVTPLPDGQPALGAALGYVSDLVADSEGSLYAIDEIRHSVVRIDPSGILQRVAGTGVMCPAASTTCTRTEPGSGLAFSFNFGFDPSEQSAIGSQGNIPPARARLARDRRGNLYVLEPRFNQVHKIDTQGEIQLVFSRQKKASDTTGVGTRRSIAVVDVDHVLLGEHWQENEEGSRLETNTISELTFSGGAYNKVHFAGRAKRATGDVAGCGPLSNPISGSLFGYPSAMTVGPDRSLYVLEACRSSTNNVRIVRVGAVAGVSQVPSADGSEIYLFDADGRHIETRDTLTGAVRFRLSYAAVGNGRPVLSKIEENPDSGSPRATTFARSGNQITITGPDGDVTKLALDAQGFLSGINQGRAGFPQISMTHDSSGLLKSYTDARGSAHTYGYDEVGRLGIDTVAGHSFKYRASVDKAAEYTVEKTTQEGRISFFTQRYGRDGSKVFEVKGPDGRSNTTVRWADGLVTRDFANGMHTEEQMVADPLASEPHSARTTVRQADGTTTASARTRYATFSNTTNLYGVSTITDNISQLQAGQASAVYGTVAGSYAGGTREWTWVQPNGLKSVTTLDTLGRPIKAKASGGAEVNIVYDTKGRVQTSDLTSRPQSGASVQKRTTTFAYDDGATSIFDASRVGTGLLVRTTDPAGAVTTIVSRDKVGRVTQARGPDSSVASFGWNDEWMLTSVTPPGRSAHSFTYDGGDLNTGYTAPSPGGAQPVDTALYTYKGDRDPDVTTLPDGRTLTSSYFGVSGKLKQLVTVDGAYGTTLKYAYPSENREEVFDTAASQGLVALSTLGIPTEQRWQASDSNVHWSVSRTLDGYMRTATLSNAPKIMDAAAGAVETTTFTYDNASNVTAVSHKRDGETAAVATETIQRYVDTTTAKDVVRGNLKATRVGWIDTSNTYDDFGSLASLSAGRRTTGSSLTGTVAYDAALFSEVIDSRDAAGRIKTRLETVSGVATAYRYDYDAAGRLTAVYKAGDLTTVKAATTPSVTYGYSVTMGGSPATGNGNRYLRDLPGGYPDEYGSYDGQDRVQSYALAPAPGAIPYPMSYVYNRAGQLTTGSNGLNTASYEYDVFGGLRKVVTGGNTYTYTNDALGRRILKKVNNKVSRRWYYKDGLKPSAEVEYNSTEKFTKVKTFVYGTSALTPDFMVVRSFTTPGSTAAVTTQVYRLIYDHLGSVRVVVDADCSGTTVTAANVYVMCVRQRLDFDEFGRRIQDSGAGFQPFGFAGGLYDPDTGLVRFGARDYDPTAGRWTARDPIKFAGGDTNLYAYVGNDPVNRIDPMGTDWTNDLGDAAVGLGDGVTFGGTKWLRNAMFGDYNVGPDECSLGYLGGQAAGKVVGGILITAGAGYAYNALTMPGRLYHFTSAANAASIAEQGVITESAGGLFGRGVYMTSSPTGSILGAASQEARVVVETAGRTMIRPTAVPGVFKHLGDLFL